MSTLTVALKPEGWLDIITDPAVAPEQRQLKKEDFDRFTGWSNRYRRALGKPDQREVLLAIGREMHTWLDGDQHVLDRLVQGSLEPPLIIEFGVGREPTPQDQSFLNAPWELLATDADPWALRETIMFCPVRRLGMADKPEPTAAHRLSAVFMAASPEGLTERGQLDFEAEEAAILKTTEQTGVDLTVEESGTLPLLEACLAREKPELVHLSCHGQIKPIPGLLLEDELGQPALATVTDLGGLAGHATRLLFLSACETAETDDTIESLAPALVKRGLPAVLGWGSSVHDREAILFAGALYRLLAKGLDLCHAVARARLELAESTALGAEGSTDWHLARLYFGPKGGGILATASGPRRQAARGRAYKAFLSSKDQKVPVAGEFEFVGRRRQIQRVLREFRRNPPVHAGVLIHGLGRQGKSSLAARVAHRLDATHELVVVYGRYDAPYIWEQLAGVTTNPGIAPIADRHRAAVQQSAANLERGLVEILQGPCKQVEKDAAGKLVSRPILLVIDDFEQCLEPQPAGKHRIKGDGAPAIAAVIKAFHKADTESRLLFTSRYQFRLEDGAIDQAGRLLDLDLVPMQGYESRKQAAAKQRFQSARALTGLDDEPKIAERLQEVSKRLDKIIDAAQGNPGLQDLLFSLCLHEPVACDRCLEELGRYLESGELPEAEAVRQFLEDLAVRSLLDLLSEGERELLRCSTLLEVPVPLKVLRQWADQAGLPHTEDELNRLVALSLWEVYPDRMHPLDLAVAVNALVRPQAGRLTEPEQAALAGGLVAGLFPYWGGAEARERRPYALDHELARLALLAGDAPVLAATAADALRHLANQFDYREAAALAKQSVALLDKAGVPLGVDLSRTAAERLRQVGEVQLANEIRKRALDRLGTGEAVGTIHHAATLLDHGRALAQQGQPDEALKFFEQAKGLLPEGRERAVVLGEIAQVLRAKGQVDQALRMHQEEMKIYEELGDMRSRAVTLGDIARILTDKGQVDQALRMHQEEMKIYEELGDTRSRAVTLGDIARILTAKGQVDQALRMHQERLNINEALGDTRSRAVTLGDIARILTAKGQVDQALRMHQEQLKLVEALGDTRSRAVTLGDIARILKNKGQVDQALRMHQERQAIYEALGDTRERAVTLGDIARILTAKGQVDQALRMHQERQAIYEALGDTRERAVTLGDIARIKWGKGESDEALKLQQERLAANEALGDLDGIAAALWDIAQIHLAREDFEAAGEPLMKSYALFNQIGRLDGIAMVGIVVGQLVYTGGHREEGLKILERSRDGFTQLGQQERAAQTQALIEQMRKAGEKKSET